MTAAKEKTAIAFDEQLLLSFFKVISNWLLMKQSG